MKHEKGPRRLAGLGLTWGVSDRPQSLPRPARATAAPSCGPGWKNGSTRGRTKEWHQAENAIRPDTNDPKPSTAHQIRASPDVGALKARAGGGNEPGRQGARPAWHGNYAQSRRPPHRLLCRERRANSRGARADDQQRHPRIPFSGGIDADRTYDGWLTPVAVPLTGCEKFMPMRRQACGIERK
jgi:hypothetical protein